MDSWRGQDRAVGPGPAKSAATALAIAGIFAVLASGLAFRPRGWARFPLVMWSLGLLAVLVAAVFRGTYRFDGIEAFGDHALLVAGATILLGSSCLRFRSAARKNRIPHIMSGRHRH